MPQLRALLPTPDLVVVVVDTTLQMHFPANLDLVDLELS
jgi:hypothetical protein